MNVAVAFDHRGVHLRDVILATLAADGHAIVDLGTDTDAVRIDYPDKAKELGDARAADENAAVCHDTYSAHQGVEHDDMNVLCLGSEVIGPSLTVELVRAFLAAQFDGGERYVRRLEKVAAMERELAHG